MLKSLPSWITQTYRSNGREGFMPDEIYQRGKNGVWQIRRARYRGVLIEGSLKTTDEVEAR